MKPQMYDEIREQLPEFKTDVQGPGETILMLRHKDVVFRIMWYKIMGRIHGPLIEICTDEEPGMEQMIIVSYRSAQQVRRLIYEVTGEPIDDPYMYLLLGEYASRFYDSYSLDGLLRAIQTGDVDAHIHTCDKYTDDPTELATIIDGWMGWTEITKEEYERINEIL